MAQRAFGKGKATRVFLALLLAFSLVGIGAVPAAADPADDTQAAVDAAQATLDEAESRMAQINSEYAQLTAEVAELQTKIDETAAAAMEAQQAMLEGRAAMGQVAVGEYRAGSSMGLMGLILDSKNFDELLRNMEYVTQIMSYQADEVAEQKERKRAFDDVSDELNAQKNEQEEALAAQEAKRAEAQSVVEDATARLEGAQEEPAARLAELAAQAEALRKQLEALVQADAEAFLPVAAAYKLPKETPEQQAHKAAVLEKALDRACAVPLEVMTACGEGIALAAEYAEKGSVLYKNLNAKLYLLKNRKK